MAMRPDALLTRADLDELPDDGHRYELVDGQLLVSPLARRRHQQVVSNLTVEIGLWCRANHGVVYPGVNVELSGDTHLEPDVAWSADEDASGVGFDRTPELVVEVASPSTKDFDRGVKLQRYAATGAQEVWLVDLSSETASVDDVARRIVEDAYWALDKHIDHLRHQVQSRRAQRGDGTPAAV